MYTLFDFFNLCDFFLQETGHNKQLAGFFCLHIMASVMIDCPPAKIAFREAIGYQRLGDLLKALGNPSEELLGSLLDMVSLLIES